MRLKNIYERDKFYELKMMIDGVRINRSFTFDTDSNSKAQMAKLKAQALKDAIDFRDSTIESFRQHGVPLSFNPTKVTFEKLVDKYQAEIVAELKSKAKVENLIKLAKERFPDLMKTKLSDLSPEIFEGIIEYLVEDGYSPATVNHYLSLCSGVLKHAAAKGFPVRNHAKDLQLELDNELTEILSRDELKKVLAEFQNERTRLGIEFLFFTGCRRSEVVRAKHADVDRAAKTMELKDTKNGKSHTVILNNTCLRIIDEMKKLDGAEGYIFKSYDKDKSGHVNIDCFTRAWRRAVKRLHERTGDEKWLRKKLHTLRHTRITEYASKVPNTIVLKDITGHKDLRSLDRYSHATNEQKRGLLGELAEE